MFLTLTQRYWADFLVQSCFPKQLCSNLPLCFTRPIITFHDGFCNIPICYHLFPAIVVRRAFADFAAVQAALDRVMANPGPTPLWISHCRVRMLEEELRDLHTEYPRTHTLVGISWLDDQPLGVCSDFAKSRVRSNAWRRTSRHFHKIHPTNHHQISAHPML